MLDCVWCVVNDWEMVLNRALSFYISACTILRCLFINPVFFEHDFCIKLFKYCNWSTISHHWQGIVWFSWFSFRFRALYLARAIENSISVMFDSCAPYEITLCVSFQTIQTKAISAWYVFHVRYHNYRVYAPPCHKWCDICTANFSNEHTSYCWECWDDGDQEIK